jgi:hypothetical protein
MPILIESPEHDYYALKKYQDKGFKCGECGATTLVAFGGLYGILKYVLRCSKDWNHSRLARESQLTALDTPDGLNIGNMGGIRRRILEQNIGKQKADALAIYSGRGQLSRVEAREIILTLWQDAPPEEVTKASIVCQQYGLNPLMKHLYLIPFNSNVGSKDNPVWKRTYSMVLGIKASRIIARRKGAYSYLDDTPRFMTVDEQLKVFGEEQKGFICAITRLSDPKGNTSIGTGKWSSTASVKGEDKGNSKLNMAMIRSERQALERLFPDSLPSDIPDVVDERYQEYEGGQVDTQTGEIKVTVENKQEQITKASPVIFEEDSLEPSAEDQAKAIESDRIASEKLAKEAKVEEPPVKNEKLISAKQVKELEEKMGVAGITNEQLGKYCNSAKNNWRVTKKSELMVWQYELLLKELPFGVPEKAK